MATSKETQANPKAANTTQPAQGNELAITQPDGKILKKITGKSMLALRKRLNLNQGDFWKLVSVTQSGGSRYESGRAIPKPTAIALAFMLGEEIKKHARHI